MKTIEKECENTLLIEKSRFITKLFFVDSEEMVKEYLREVKFQYPDATHHCYGYVIYPGKEKASDDQEPAKTAGMPILEALKRADLVNVLAIVIRYFGGIKLGTSGLVKAYSRSVTEAIAIANTKELCYKYYLEMQLSYQEYGKLEHYLKEYTTNASFGVNVNLSLVIAEDNYRIFTKTMEKYYVSYRVKDMKLT